MTSPSVPQRAAAARSTVADIERAVMALAVASAMAGTVLLLTYADAPEGLVLGAALLLVGALLRWPDATRRVLAGLTATALLPTLLLIALAVRLSGPGPVLVRQDSPGVAGPADGVLRFRTTTATGAGSSRTNRVGRMLRVLGVDALPGLIDVARGAPSGPGPAPADHRCATGR